MVSIIENFVTVRKNRHDVLNPTQYRSIIEMIRALLKNVDGLKSATPLINAHVNDLNDPHDEGRIVKESITSFIYDIYSKMTLTPMSLIDFKTFVVPSLDFLELLRRIGLNRYLYNDISDVDGSVPSSVSAVLGLDWEYLNTPLISILLSFDTPIDNEDDFIQYRSDSVPIFDSDFDQIKLDDRRILFETSSASPYNDISNTSIEYSKDIYLVKNSLTAYVRFVYSPTNVTPIVSFNTSSGSVILQVNPDKSLDLIVDSNNVITDTVISSDGAILVNIIKNDRIQIITNTGIYEYLNPVGGIFFLTEQISSVSVLTKLEDLSANSNIFGLRQFVIYDYIEEILQLIITTLDDLPIVTLDDVYLQTLPTAG